MKSRPNLLILVSFVVAVTSGCAAWRIRDSTELVRLSQPFQQSPPVPERSLLIVGDSTAVGTGASLPERSLAGLIGQRHSRWRIENRARNGAKIADVLAQLDGAERFDLVLVLAGGNDVIRLKSEETMQTGLDTLAAKASAIGGKVVFMPAGNIGNAPFFFAPLSWWMSSRSASLHSVVKSTAQRSGARYVNLYRERADDPFVLNPELNAIDGLHPSDAGYQQWFKTLVEQGGLD